MPSKEKMLATEYKKFSPPDLLEARMMVLCYVLMLYAKTKYFELGELYEGKISSVAEEMIEEYPQEAYQFCVRLLTEFDRDSDSSMEKNLGISMVGIPRFRQTLLEDLNDEEMAISFFDSLQKLITFDIDSVPMDKMRGNGEASSKMQAMMLVFELKGQTSSPAFRQLYAEALIELANPRVVNAIHYFKDFADTDYIYKALKNKLPDAF
jgi:hypothetical protein